MIGDCIRPLVKNVPTVVVLLFIAMASSIAVSCDPGESGFQASPSAFRSACGTTLYYNVPDLANVSAVVKVQDHDGIDVRTFVLGNVTPGNHELCWDAKDGGGITVPDGTYTMQLSILNDNETIARTCNVIVDSIAPGTTITFSGSPRADGSYGQGVTFSLSGTDTGSGISTYHYNVNNHGWETWCGPVALDDAGQYTILYKAIDNAGNYEIQTITVPVSAYDLTVTPTPASTPAPTPTPKPTATPTPVPAASAVRFRRLRTAAPGQSSGILVYLSVLAIIAAAFGGMLYLVMLRPKK